MVAVRGNVKVHQKKIIARRRRRLALLSLWAVLLVGIVFSGLSFLLNLDALLIQNVRVEGNARLASSTVSALVRSELAGDYGFFFSRSDAFLYPRGAIARALAALPLVKSVDVSREGLKTVVIRIVERAEAAVWCPKVRLENIACSSVDENGFAFAPSFDASSTSLIVYRSSFSGSVAGTSIMPAESFKNAQFFVRELSGLGLEPREVSIEDAGYLSILLAGGGTLIVNENDDLSNVLSNLAAVFADKATVPDKAAFLSKLDYMRLDAGNKIFYKLRK